MEENVLRFAFREVLLSTEIYSISLPSVVLGGTCKGWILLHLHIGALPLCGLLMWSSLFIQAPHPLAPLVFM